MSQPQPPPDPDATDGTVPDGAATAEPSATIDLDVTAPHQARPPRRLMPALVAGGLTLTLLVGLGVGYKVLSGDDRRPERFTPESVSAFVSVDLDPGLGQKISLFRLARKLPESPGGGDVSDAQGMAERLLTRLNLRGVDVGRDLMSWLGPRAAVSVWTGPQGRTYGLLSAVSTDDAAAGAGLRRIADAREGKDVGFVVKDGTVLVAIGDGDAEAAARAAADEAAQSPLADLAAFRQARQWLDDDQVVLVWADLDRLRATMLPDEPGVTLPAELRESYRGTAVLGVRANDDGIEARYHTFGAGLPATAGADALTRLGRLPGNSAVGAVLTVPDDLSATGSYPFSAVGLTFGGLGLPFLLGGLAVVEPTGSEPGLNLSDDEQAELDALMGKDPARLTAAERKRYTELAGFSPPDPACDMSRSAGDLDKDEQAEVERLMAKNASALTKAELARLRKLTGVDPIECGFVGWGPTLTEAENRELEKLMAKDPATFTDAERERFTELTGFSPDDMAGGGPGGEAFTALRGASIEAAMSSVGDEPSFRLSAVATSPDAAQALADLVESQADALDTAVQGTTVTAASPGYAAGGGTLVDQDLFQLAMPRLAGAQLAIYADLGSLPERNRPSFPLRAVGVTEQVRDGDLTGTVRLIIS